MAKKKTRVPKDFDWKTSDLGEPAWVSVDADGKRRGWFTAYGAPLPIAGMGGGGSDNKSRTQKLLSSPLTAVWAVVMVLALGVGFVAYETISTGGSYEDAIDAATQKLQKEGAEEAARAAMGKVLSQSTPPESTTEEATEDAQEAETQVVVVEPQGIDSMIVDSAVAGARGGAIAANKSRAKSGTIVPKKLDVKGLGGWSIESLNKNIDAFLNQDQTDNSFVGSAGTTGTPIGAGNSLTPVGLSSTDIQSASLENSLLNADGQDSPPASNEIP